MATGSHASAMSMGEGERTTVVQIDLPVQPHVLGSRLEGSGEEVAGTVNSSRWSDAETMTLLGLWRANYRLIKGKKRNYQEWNMIAREFNRRVAHCSLGPRTGNQCKVRIKNLLAEYNRTKEQLPHSFPYHDILKEIIDNKGVPFNQDDMVTINIPAELGSLATRTEKVVSATPTTHINIPPDNTTPKPLRSIAPAPPTTPLNAPIASSQGGPLPVPVQVYSEGVPQTSTVVATSGVITTEQSVGSEDESSDEDSYTEEMPVVSHKRSHAHWHSTSNDPSSVRKKPRKNPRPVKMAQSRQDDISMIAILREFLEDSRKREEDLFKRILQQQLEAESRYQQFTLDVLKEIGKMFKKE